MTSGRLRRWADRLRRTPLHPQWLLGPPEKMADWVCENCRGLVLDIGAADRWIEKHLDSSVRYVSLDYPATGQDLYHARPDLFGNASRLPFHDHSIDTVVLLEVLEHLEEPRAALEEIHRVLKPGGTLLLSLPFLYPLHDAPFDFQRYTEFGLKRELDASGFEVEELQNTVGSSSSAGLLAALAISGAMIEAIQNRRPSVLLLPVLMTSIPLINLLAWTLERLTPNWSPLSAGLQTRATAR